MRKRLTEELYRVKEAASNGARREISDDYQYDKKKLKHIKFVLHNINVSLGALVSAVGRFSKMKGPEISPDGMLGGLGYIMPIRNIKEQLSGIVRSLSDIQDTLADELTNPKWEAGEDKEIKKLIKEKEDIEEQVEEEMAPDTDESIMPEDVITSEEIVDETYKLSKTAEDKFSETVRNFLVNFNLGKQ